MKPNQLKKHTYTLTTVPKNLLRGIFIYVIGENMNKAVRSEMMRIIETKKLLEEIDAQVVGEIFNTLAVQGTKRTPITPFELKAFEHYLMGKSPSVAWTIYLIGQMVQECRDYQRRVQNDAYEIGKFRNQFKNL